ncbi:hypothetical protein Htur_1887 [Haloterrigena turkmenica DSM 5511]|uniref:Uncharacterized protein n=1 Tax=Haloterrigena turkmenica (strain ATCC 51198 / DSM 5511 / JCM 9101 / NCIMB 13204 / VKM B-1734 / 4k) TaxID=543526 RepID=D2RSJ6_HALTV|nr:hypothetical protein Htur_1887 [Haloterrigena turkmenica DSM 5511]
MRVVARSPLARDENPNGFADTQLSAGKWQYE